MHMTPKRLSRLFGIFSAVALLGSASTAWANCKVTDFTDRTLSSLSDVERLSFVAQMRMTEFEKLKRLPPTDPNYFALIANSANVAEAREAATAKVATLKWDNLPFMMRIWATDYLSDQQLRDFNTCNSNRLPGLEAIGRWETPSEFHLSFVHLTSVGIEKIRIQLVAHNNIVNNRQLETFLTGLGAQDRFPATTVPVQVEDPSKPAVLVLRGGWETPLFVFIPPAKAPRLPNDAESQPVAK